VGEQDKSGLARTLALPLERVRQHALTLAMGKWTSSARSAGRRWEQQAERSGTRETDTGAFCPRILGFSNMTAVQGCAYSHCNSITWVAARPPGLPPGGHQCPRTLARHERKQPTPSQAACLKPGSLFSSNSCKHVNYKQGGSGESWHTASHFLATAR